MKKRYLLALLFSHLFVAGGGFIMGIYLLPIMTAPAAPQLSVLESTVQSREFSGQFSRERVDSDLLHWGEGEVSISQDSIAFIGKLAPGPDYRLYLSPEFVETELDFNRLKSSMVQVGEIKTFDNFQVALPENIDPSNYVSLIVWCESFGQFITSGTYETVAQ
ncbi:DM13 domain-containing protein [Shewanella nanhaiensis]|uniref:DM13 domain-containing protein n=1 Tax=Shewanella nanhaiensis TaxID=2864872 RepID=A0ABS7E2A1_9GAMM|nr:DM13 domain-containing protein [Shewanella nanhaiensis]MBW8183833.1 DM13 domain-containing protein [Shewanella nanhaiensis]